MSVSVKAHQALERSHRQFLWRVDTALEFCESDMQSLHRVCISRNPISSTQWGLNDLGLLHKDESNVQTEGSVLFYLYVV
jgi:hypothetical protein